jgi:7SK snRNA methylphosphate capping enzyme
MNGNYHGYYQKRNDLDERISYFHPEWFQQKVCLDVGCNDGLVTIAVAERFRPEFITGLDIDKFLIESADSRIKRVKYALNVEKKTVVPALKPAANPTERDISRFVPRCLSVGTTSIASKKSVSAVDAVKENDYGFPGNIAFVQKDVFSLETGCDGRYDTVLCLSVTKWIHLTRGDAGVMTLFATLSSLLKPDGLLVLEFQAWKSYKKRKCVNQEMLDNLENIKIFPNMFEEILLTKFNFTVVMKKNDSSEESHKGFHRPLLVLRKVLPSSEITLESSSFES